MKNYRFKKISSVDAWPTVEINAVEYVTEKGPALGFSESESVVKAETYAEAKQQIFKEILGEFIKKKRIMSMKRDKDEMVINDCEFCLKRVNDYITNGANDSLKSDPNVDEYRLEFLIIGIRHFTERDREKMMDLVMKMTTKHEGESIERVGEFEILRKRPDGAVARAVVNFI